MVDPVACIRKFFPDEGLPGAGPGGASHLDFPQIVAVSSGV